MEPDDLPHTAVDATMFTILEGRLQILLIKRSKPPFEGCYALPGGFVKEHESLDCAAKRELEAETNVSGCFLVQMKTYGTVKRDPRRRIISTAFMALIDPSQELIAADGASEAEWFNIYELPDIAFDHKQIILDALKELRILVQTTNIACQILPERFTLSQLQQLYEVILDKELDKRNFRKRVKDLHMVEETKFLMMEGAHRPARLYKFVSHEYVPLSEKISVFLA